jgi:hypothetical protein
MASSAVSSANVSAANSGAEDNGDMAFRAKKKKKMTKKEMKERESRRRLRHIEWLVPLLPCTHRTLANTFPGSTPPKEHPIHQTPTTRLKSYVTHRFPRLLATHTHLQEVTEIISCLYITLKRIEDSLDAFGLFGRGHIELHCFTCGNLLRAIRGVYRLDGRWDSFFS